MFNCSRIGSKLEILAKDTVNTTVRRHYTEFIKKHIMTPLLTNYLK